MADFGALLRAERQRQAEQSLPPWVENRARVACGLLAAEDVFFAALELILRRAYFRMTTGLLKGDPFTLKETPGFPPSGPIDWSV